MADTESGLVSVIILNWNGGEVVLRCVQSVIEQSHRSIELIVIDNGSCDGSMEHIREMLTGVDRFERVHCISHLENLGYAAGMNSGIRAAAGAYALLLNMDVYLDPQFVEVGVRTFAGEKDIGMVGAKIFRLVDGRRTNQVASTGLMLRRRVQFAGLRDDAGEQDVFGPNGCCPLLRRKMLEDVKMPSGDYFAKEFFAYHEDTDLWFRAQLRGWRCRYQPAAQAWHVHSASTGGKVRLTEKPPLYQYHTLKNRYLVILRTFPGGLLVRLLPSLFLTECLMIPYFLLMSPRILLQLPRAWLYVARSIGPVLAERAHIQASRTASIAHLRTLFISF